MSRRKYNLNKIKGGESDDPLEIRWEEPDRLGDPIITRTNRSKASGKRRCDRQK